MRPLAEVGAPGLVVLEELPPDVPRDGVVQHVGGVVGGEGAALAELRVGEEEHEVLPLVADVVELEAEGGAEPVEEVGAEGVPGAGERRRRQVRRVRQRLHGRAHLREPQRRVVPVHHHVVDRDDVVRRRLRVPPTSSRRRRRRGGAAVAEEAHPSRLAVVAELQKKTGKASAPSRRRSDECGVRNQAIVGRRSSTWESGATRTATASEIAVTRCGADEVGIM